MSSAGWIDNSGFKLVRVELDVSAGCDAGIRFWVRLDDSARGRDGHAPTNGAVAVITLDRRSDMICP